MKKMTLFLINIILLTIGCTPEPMITPDPVVDPMDTIPPVNPLYDYDLLWALPMVTDTGASANSYLPIMYKNNVLFGGVFDWLEGGYDQYLVLLNPDTLEQVWKWDGFNSDYGNRHFVTSTVMDNVLYGSDNLRLFGVNLENGQTVLQIDTWRSNISASNDFLFYNDNKSIAQRKSAALYKFNPVDESHELIYEIEEGGEWFNFLGSCTSTYNEEGDEILYFMHAGYRFNPFKDTTILYCYNNQTKNILWQYGTSNETFSSKPPIIDENRLYFGTVNDMYCLNKETGELLWKEEPQVAYSSLAKLVDDKIIRISLEGHFKALDKMTGELLYEYDYGSGYTENMEYLDGRMYYADGGQLNIIDVATGERLYRWKTKNDIKSSLNFTNHVALDPARGVMYVSDWAYMNCIRIPE